MSECPTCPRALNEWPDVDCDSPALHAADYVCDCGDVVTVAAVIRDPRRHRRCNEVG